MAISSEATVADVGSIIDEGLTIEGLPWQGRLALTTMVLHKFIGHRGGVSIYISEGPGRSLWLSQNSGIEARPVMGWGEPAAGLTAREREVLFMDDARHLFGDDSHGISQVIDVPITKQSVVVGVLEVRTKDKARLGLIEVEVATGVAASLSRAWPEALPNGKFKTS